jgi:hypothetical protein
MVVVDNAAMLLRNYFTTVSDFLGISSSTTDTISVTSSTMASTFTNISASSITYPSDKKFTREYILDSLSSNGEFIRRIGVKNTSTTTNVMTLSNIPELEKNASIEVSFEVTLEIDNNV